MNRRVREEESERIGEERIGEERIGEYRIRGSLWWRVKRNRRLRE